MISDEKTGKPRSLPDLGQQSMAFELSKGEAHAYVRVGTVVVYVSEQGSHDDYKPAVLESLARMAATWAQQAQDGKTPARRLRSDPDRIRRSGRRSAAGPAVPHRGFVTPSRGFVTVVEPWPGPPPAARRPGGCARGRRGSGRRASSTGSDAR